jgi:cysteinyl-tRNA synthetase
MTIQLHDTLSDDVRPFAPLDGERARIYSCGPTVYGPAHIGNFRSFLFADLLVRHLRWRGVPVTWVMNITDIDDKIIKGAATAGSMRANSPTVSRVIPRGRRRAGHDPPGRAAAATAHIPRSSTSSRRSSNTSTRTGPTTARSSSGSHRGPRTAAGATRPRAARVGERVEADEYAKDDVRDFALWKAPKPGEPSWETSIGPGRPGWHIECSAMSMRHLGPSFDIHTGGVDLIFPHHEDEIAQSEAATGQPFVETWLHCAHLQMGGSKMAKSSGNIARVRDLLDAGHSPRAIRYSLISVHYRVGLITPMRPSAPRSRCRTPRRARRGVDCLPRGSRRRCRAPRRPRRGSRGVRCGARRRPRHLAGSGCPVRARARPQPRIDGRSLSSADAERALGLLRDLDQVLGVLPEEADALDPKIAEMLEARAAARAARDWAASDRLRDELAERGVAVEDTRDGQRWRRLSESVHG